MTGGIHKQFSAYEGDEPFIFVSYCHADMKEVYQDIEHLHNAGYRIWYDEGVRASDDLYEKMPQRIAACSYFVVFLSPDAVQSTFIPREVLYGLEKRKPILPVYLSEFRLPPQLELPLIAPRKLKKYEQPREQYLRQLIQSIPESVFGTVVNEKGPPVIQNRSTEQNSYDVFISYRRESGSAEARLIQEKLRQRNKRAFLDVNDLRPGHFDEELLKRIEEARNFIIILSPNCLARCADERDWLRQEIVHALKTDRNIIPIMLPGFGFPDSRSLPDELQTLATHHGVSYNHEYFDAMVDKIVRHLEQDQ